MSDLIRAGIELMLLGMGAVFIFLVLLILATSLMSKFIIKFQGQPETVEATPIAFVRSPVSPVIDSHVLQVISDAVKQHRASP